MNVGQAHKADVILRQAGFGQTDPQTEIVLVQGTGITVTSPAFRAAVNDVVRSVAPFTTIKNLRSPLDPAYGDQVSPDGRTALVEWEMKGTADVGEDPHRRDHVGGRRGREASPVASTSARPAAISSGKALDKMFKDQLKQAGSARSR